jgi:hypothetical protein
MGLTLGTVNLSDRTKYKYSESDDQPNYEIRILKGCGASSFPMVQVFRHVYTVRPYIIVCLGSTIDTAVANRDAVLAELVAAADRTQPPVLLTRTVHSQTTPDVWTVLGGVPKRIRQEWDGLYKVWCPVDLYVYPGTRIPAGV